MSVASQLLLRVFGDVLRAAQDGAQDTLGGMSLRAGGDRVGVRPVEVAEADAVVRYLGVVRGQFQLASGFAQVNAAVAHL